MISPKEFMKATVSLKNNGIDGNIKIQGFPLLQTDKELFFFELNSKKTKSELIFIERNNIESIIFPGGYKQILSEIYKERGAETDAKNGGIKMALISLF